MGLTPVFAGLPVVAGRAPSPDEGMSGRQGERCYRKEELGSRIRHPTAGALKAEAPWVWGSEDLAEAGMWNRRPRTPELTPQTRGSIRSRRVPTARLRIPYLASCPAWTALMHAVHIHRATCPRGRPRRCSGLCVVCPSHSNGPLPFSCLASGNRLIIFSRPPFPAPVSLTPPPPPGGSCWRISWRRSLSFPSSGHMPSLSHPCSSDSPPAHE